MPEMKVVVIGGTLALKPLARPYYWLLCLLAGHAKLVTLPDGGLRSLADTYPVLSAQIQAICPDDEPMILIGHSQGALLAAMYAAAHTNVMRIVAISGPFGGVATCHAARFLPSSLARRLPILRDLTPGSAALTGLAELLVGVRERLICIYTPYDGIVWPASSCRVEGARVNIRLSPIANHLTEILRREVWLQIEQARQEAVGEYSLRLVS